MAAPSAFGKILHQLAFLQQEDAGGDVGNEVEVMAGDDDRGALLLADALNHVGDSHLRRWVKIVERLIQEKNLRIDNHRPMIPIFCRLPEKNHGDTSWFP